MFCKNNCVSGVTIVNTIVKFANYSDDPSGTDTFEDVKAKICQKIICEKCFNHS